jgi:hypothetical protein
MSRGLIFWILMLIWFVFALVIGFGVVRFAWSGTANDFLLFVLFLLLGWQVYGPPIRG